MSEPLRHNRDFMLLWSGQVVSALGTAVSSAAFPLLVLALKQSPAKAVVIGAGWVRAACASPAVQHAPRVTAIAAGLEASGATPAPWRLRPRPARAIRSRHEP